MKDIVEYCSFSTRLDISKQEDPRKAGYVFREDGKFYKKFENLTEFTYLSHRACFKDNGSVGVPYPSASRNVLMNITELIIPVGIYRIDLSPNLTWVTYDG